MFFFSLSLLLSISMMFLFLLKVYFNSFSDKNFILHMNSERKCVFESFLDNGDMFDFEIKIRTEVPWHLYRWNLQKKTKKSSSWRIFWPPVDHNSYRLCMWGNLHLQVRSNLPSFVLFCDSLWHSRERTHQVVCVHHIILSIWMLTCSTDTQTKFPPHKIEIPGL